MKYFLSAAILTCAIVIIGSGGCNANREYRAIQKYKEVTAEGELAMNKSSYETAALSFRAADEIAKEMQWGDGRVMARVRLSDAISTGKKDYEQSLAILFETKAICLGDPDCSAEQLAIIYKSLFFILIYQLKDPLRALDIAQDSLEHANRLGGCSVAISMLETTKAQLRGGGYPDAADKLRAYKCSS